MGCKLSKTADMEVGVVEASSSNYIKCAAYVQKVLDERRIAKGDAGAYQECLCDMPGSELTFNFETNEITKPEREIRDTDEDHHESLEDLDISERRIRWDNGGNDKMRYVPPEDVYTTVYEDTIDVVGTSKRLIYVLSDLHLGGDWSMGMEAKLQIYFDKLMKKASDEVACLVLLGDIFEMWLEKYHEVPPSNSTRIKTWSNEVKIFISAVKRLVDDHSVKVYYVRGNHDREATESDISKIFDGKVTFVACTLILHIKTSSKRAERVRFSHGHQWDVFNSYVLCQSNGLLPDKPIGYYISRAVATSGGKDDGSDLESLLIGLAQSVLTAVPNHLEDHLVDVLMDPHYNRKLLERLFEGAFKVKDIKTMINAKCRTSEDAFIKLATMLEYPLLSLMSDLVGKQDVFHMIKAATGDYKKFIKRSDEDVVVIAHTHKWDLKRYKNYKGNCVIYANTGCWSRHAKEYSAVVLSPPSDSDGGEISIDYGSN